MAPVSAALGEPGRQRRDCPGGLAPKAVLALTGFGGPTRHARSSQAGGKPTRNRWIAGIGGIVLAAFGPPGSAPVPFDRLAFAEAVTLNHRVTPGEDLDVTVDFSQTLRPVNRKVLGLSFFMVGDGEASNACVSGLPLDHEGNYTLRDHPCGNYEPAVRGLNLRMTRVYDIGIFDRWQHAKAIGLARNPDRPPWYFHHSAKEGIDRWAQLADTLGIPQENVVLGTSLYTSPTDRELIYPPPEYWRELVQYSVSRGYRFRHWEIGNEVYLPGEDWAAATDFVINGFSDPPLWDPGTRTWVYPGNLDQAAERFSRYLKMVSATIRSVQPEGRLGLSFPGPDDGPKPNTWSQKILEAAAGAYDFLVGHYYASGAGAVCDTCFGAFTAAYNYALLRTQLWHLEHARRTSGRQVVHYDTEWGGYATRSYGDWNPSPEVRNKNSFGAIMQAVRLMYYLREGIVDGAGCWGVFTRDPVEQVMPGVLTHRSPDLRSMVYWLYVTFHQFLGDEILDISGRAPFYFGQFQAYNWTFPVDASGPYTPLVASRDKAGKKLFLIIANAKEDASYPLRIATVGFQGKTLNCLLFRDFRPGDWRDLNPFVAGVTGAEFVRPYGDCQLSPDGAHIRGTLPPRSVLFIQVEGAADATHRRPRRMLRPHPGPTSP